MLAQAQTQLLQLVKLYPAPWREAAQTVLRNETGQFASQGTKTLERQVAPKPKPQIAKKIADFPYKISQGHILKGDVIDGQLKGGMHTQDALDDFVDNYGYDYDILRTNKNGVKEVELPIEAMKPFADGTIPENRKTLFPESWDEEDIMEAIQDIIKNTDPKEFGDRKTFEGLYKGVRIRIGVRGDRVVTAFPKI